ncbi:unnamed protein product [Arctogadus glacialis]
MVISGPIFDSKLILLLLRRLRRLCTEETDMQRATGTLFRVLRGRGYTKRFLRSILSGMLVELGRWASSEASPPSGSSSPASPCPNLNPASPCPNYNQPSLRASPPQSPPPSHPNHSISTAFHPSQLSLTTSHLNPSSPTPLTLTPRHPLRLTLTPRLPLSHLNPSSPTPSHLNPLSPTPSHRNTPAASTVDPHHLPNPNQLPSSTPHLNRLPSHTGGADLGSAPVHRPAEVGPPLGGRGSLSQVVFP